MAILTPAVQGYLKLILNNAGGKFTLLQPTTLLWEVWVSFRKLPYAKEGLTIPCSKGLRTHNILVNRFQYYY